MAQPDISNLSGEQFLRTVPKQKRSAERIDHILDAVGTVLERGGIEALNITSVSAESGVAPASIYDYFRDTPSMIGAFMARARGVHWDAILEVLGTEIQAADITERMRQAFVRYVEVANSMPGFRQADAFCDGDPVLHAFRVNDVKTYTALLAALMRPHTPTALLGLVEPRALLATYLMGPMARLLSAVDDTTATELRESYIEMFLAPLPVR